MTDKNPEINRENPSIQHPEAEEAFYDERTKPREIRNWPTEAEKSEHADKTGKILQFKPKAADDEKKPVSDVVAQLVAELHASKNPYEAFEKLRLQVENKKVEAFDAAEALAWQESPPAAKPDDLDLAA